jgi:dipeptidyl aminopeptidase/acylaminoacyl peptidase
MRCGILNPESWLKEFPMRILFILAIGALLAACASPAVAPLPTSEPTITVGQPTSAPTMLPEPTAVPATPTVAPTAAPEPAAVLPAPLYFLEEGQVVRLETDGRTRTTLTNEVPFTSDALAIIELAVSPSDGTLAYIVQGDGGNTLVLTDADGANRRELIAGAPINAPRWSPDGSAIVVQASSFVEGETPWQGGIWVVSAFSGEARQLIASDPIPTDGVSETWGYAPEAWSPDGSKLLVSRYSMSVEVCEAAIITINSAELTLLQVPAGNEPYVRVQCAGGAWAADSSGFYTVIRGGGLTPPEPGLYFADARTAQLSVVIPAQNAAGLLNLVQAQAVSPAGELLAVIAQVEHMPDPAVDPGLIPANAALYRIAADGTLEQVNADPFMLYGMPLWAPDGSGTLVPVLTDAGGVAYRYILFGGEAMMLDLEPTTALAWGG